MAAPSASSPSRSPDKKAYNHGGNPLAHILSGDSARLPAFGGAFQPGLYRAPKSNFANPVPLGLSGFALTTFVLSLVNLGVRGLSNPAIVIAPALVYGGFIQLLAGMWDIALGTACTRGSAANPRIHLHLYRKHVWRHGTLIVRWLLDKRRHHLDSRWLPG